MMRRLICLHRSHWPAEWQRSVDERFDRVDDCSTLAQLLVELAHDRTAIALVAIGESSAATTLEALKRVDAPICARIMLVSEIAFAPLAQMAAAGVADFVTPATPWSEVAYRLQLRLNASHAALFARGSASMDSTSALSAPGLLAQLTQKEHDLYQLLARRLGEPVSRDEILRAVWDRDPDSTSNIVEVYVKYLRDKLSIAAPHLEVQTVRRVGYALRERPEMQSDTGRRAPMQSPAERRSRKRS